MASKATAHTGEEFASLLAPVTRCTWFSARYPCRTQCPIDRNGLHDGHRGSAAYDHAGTIPDICWAAGKAAITRQTIGCAGHGLVGTDRPASPDGLVVR